MPASTEVRSGGRRLQVRRLGDGPRLVALHGGPGLDHHVLAPLAAPLADRYSMWLPDLPGHGASAPARGPRPGLWMTLDDLKHWLADLPGGVDVLLGHSLGAWLAQEVLRARVIRPRAAVLLAPLAGDRGPSPPIPRRRAGRVDPLADLCRHVESEINGELPREFVRTLAAARLRPVSDYPALLEELRVELERPMRPLDPCCPVLVLGGERDGAASPDALERVSRAIARSEIAILDGEGHYPFVESGPRVAGVIREFLDRVPHLRRARK